MPAIGSPGLDMLRNAIRIALRRPEMVGPIEPQDPTSPKTLATAGLPRRVRRVLERALGLFTEEVERNLVSAVSEFEEELFRLADRASTTGGSSVDYMQTLRVVRLNRHDLSPRFFQLLEAGLAGIRKPQSLQPTTLSRPSVSNNQPLNFRNLSLVDESVMDEGAVLHEIATRQESRTNLVLHLLGQRFGVLAGAPAFDSERIPLGPQALCRALRQASDGLQLEHEARLLFYRIFDRRVMAQYQSLSEKLDALLVEEGILPSLSYVPMRSRGGAGGGGGDDDEAEHDLENAEASVRAAAARAVASQIEARAHQGGAPPMGLPARARQAPGHGGGAPHGAPLDPNRPHTAWMGQPAYSSAAVDEQAAFHDLQQLLSGRRAHAERINPTPPGMRPELTISTRDLLHTLGRMDAEPASPGGGGPSLSDIKQSLLTQARQHHGKAVALAQSDNDTFELVGLLYNHLQSEIRDDAPAAALIRRMQLTLLRVALQDRAFFVRPNHPARQLLNTVSETAAKWLADDDFDPQLLAPLQQAVTHAVKNFNGDVSVFEESNKQLQTHIDAQVRRAETMERRHIEAARGKEKLEVAKQRAEQTLDQVIGEKDLPKFTRALLKQAWADVLTLTFLRHGEESEEWRKQVEATRQIVDACSLSESGVQQPALKNHVEAALKQVGYHEDEADVIAQRLSSNLREEEESESRTELTMKLKARVRLGEDAQKARKPDLPPRTPREQECYEQLRLLPFGTWIEFVTNQQGDVVRRRMSWFSPVTDNALFVNQRGQRIGEHSLDSLARMMAKDQVRIVTAQRAGLVDRAWHAALNALRSFAGLRDEHEDTTEAAGDPATAAAPVAATASSSPAPSPPPVPAKPPAPPAAIPYPGLIGDESAPPPDKGVR